MRSTLRRAVVAAMLLLLLVIALTASAQGLSVGCANTGASALNGTFTANSASFGAVFNTGEVLTFQVNGAPPAVFQLNQGTPFPLTPVVSSPVNGQFVYVYTITSSVFRLLEVAETAGGTITVAASCVLPSAPPGPGSSSSSETQVVSLPPCLNLLDGRINNKHHLDCGAPIAIYTGSIEIYSIDPATSRGHLTLRLTDDEIAAAGVPAVNTLLAAAPNPFTGRMVSVYVLTTGEIQVNTFYADGKPYTVAWPASQPSALYHLDW